MIVTSESNVYEDNNDALIVSTCSRLTPTSVFIATKNHCFCQDINSGEIDISMIHSKNQQLIYSQRDFKVNLQLN